MHHATWSQMNRDAGRRVTAMLGAIAIVAASMITGVVGSSSPVLAVSDSSIRAASVDDTSLFSWGRNNRLQLGNGTTVASSPVPVAVSPGLNTTNLWHIASAGNQHACALGTDDSLYCWGSDSSGQLGNGSMTNSDAPKTVLLDASWVSVDAGVFNTCGVTVDRAAYCWGENNYGQLGNGTADDTNTPALVSAGANSSGRWMALSAGNSLTCGISDNNAAYCWGENDHGQLGNGTSGELPSLDAVAVSNGANSTGLWQSVSASNGFVCGISDDGSAYCWGENNYGQLGNGTTADDSVPVAAANGANPTGQWKSISAGVTHTCAIGSDDSAYCWGANAQGQLGNNSTTDDSVAVRALIPGDAPVRSLSAGENFTCAATDSATFCWGANSRGQLGDNSIISSPLPVEVVSSGVLSGVSVKTVSVGDEFVVATGLAPGAGTVPSQPGAPAGTPGDAEVSLVWSAPSDGGSPIIGYRVEWSTDGGANWTTATADSGSTLTTYVVTGLTNGTTYTFRVSGINSIGTGTASSASSAVTPSGSTPPGPTPDAPSAPGGVIAQAGSEAATVFWQAPASPGSFPVTSYQVTAVPGGGSCLATAPTLTCVISGLTNDATYTASVRALNGAGWGPYSSSSDPFTPTADAPPLPSPVPVLDPGEAYVTVNDVPQPVAVEANGRNTRVDLAGDDFTMDLSGLDTNDRPAQLDPDGVLLLRPDRKIRTTGTGFSRTSKVNLFVDPPTLLTSPITVSTNAIKGVFIGTVTTNTNGTFTGAVVLPPETPAGRHVIQAVGYTRSGALRAVSLGVRVTPALTLAQGTRTADGRHDRIRTTGTSTGIPDGSRLTPYIRYGNRGAFTEGKATIVVQADGSFRWTREIRKNRAVTGYVTWKSTESNRVTWLKIR
jgi:alpha-tubulin suppressor-like RCC1 family protein